MAGGDRIRQTESIGRNGQGAPARAGRDYREGTQMTSLDVHNDVRHAGEADLPWVDATGGIWLKVLRVDAASGIWVVANRFAPGVTLQTHRHTGPVDGYTISGRWHYLEYDFYSTAGSYIREPAGSVHTLDVPADNDGITEVLFVMEGVNLDLRPDGTVENVIDGSTTLAAYEALAISQGFGRPTGVIIG
jgi:quercetin dioxygenase-like cupin family protein